MDEEQLENLSGQFEDLEEKFFLFVQTNIGSSLSQRESELISLIEGYRDLASSYKFYTD